VPALHAAALEPDLFASVKLRQGLHSWAEVLPNPEPAGILEQTVHGALRTYDLPDLTRLLGTKKLTFEN